MGNARLRQQQQAAVSGKQSQQHATITGKVQQWVMHNCSSQQHAAVSNTRNSDTRSRGTARQVKCRVYCKSHKVATQPPVHHGMSNTDRQPSDPTLPNPTLPPVYAMQHSSKQQTKSCLHHCTPPTSAVGCSWTPPPWVRPEFVATLHPRPAPPPVLLLSLAASTHQRLRCSPAVLKTWLWVVYECPPVGCPHLPHLLEKGQCISWGLVTSPSWPGVCEASSRGPPTARQA
jgi:hypothetical protein